MKVVLKDNCKSQYQQHKWWRLWRNISKMEKLSFFDSARSLLLAYCSWIGNVMIKCLMVDCLGWKFLAVSWSPEKKKVNLLKFLCYWNVIITIVILMQLLNGMIHCINKANITAGDKKKVKHCRFYCILETECKKTTLLKHFSRNFLLQIFSIMCQKSL